MSKKKIDCTKGRGLLDTKVLLYKVPFKMKLNYYMEQKDLTL